MVLLVGVKSWILLKRLRVLIQAYARRLLTPTTLALVWRLWLSVDYQDHFSSESIAFSGLFDLSGHQQAQEKEAPLRKSLDHQYESDRNHRPDNDKGQWQELLTGIFREWIEVGKTISEHYHGGRSKTTWRLVHILQPWRLANSQAYFECWCTSGLVLLYFEIVIWSPAFATKSGLIIFSTPDSKPKVVGNGAKGAPQLRARRSHNLVPPWYRVARSRNFYKITIGRNRSWTKQWLPRSGKR